VLESSPARLSNRASRWPRPFFPGTCITWTSSAIAVGWDFALDVLREQMAEPASRERPVEVIGGRLCDLMRRQAAGGLGTAGPSAPAGVPPHGGPPSPAPPPSPPYPPPGAR